MKFTFSSFLALTLATLLSGCHTTSNQENPSPGLAAATSIGAATTNPVLADAGSAIAATDSQSMTTDSNTPAAAQSIHQPHPKVHKAIASALNKPSNNVVVKRAILKSSPIVAYQDQSFCKKYKKIIEADGHTTVKFGIACKQPTGKWRMMT